MKAAANWSRSGTPPSAPPSGVRPRAQAAPHPEGAQGEAFVDAQANVAGEALIRGGTLVRPHPWGAPGEAFVDAQADVAGEALIRGGTLVGPRLRGAPGEARAEGGAAVRGEAHVGDAPSPGPVSRASGPAYSSVRGRASIPVDLHDLAFTEFVKAQVAATSAYARVLRVPFDCAEDIRQRALEKLFPLAREIPQDSWQKWLWNAMCLNRLSYLRGLRKARKHHPAFVRLLLVWRGCANLELDIEQREHARHLLELIARLGLRRRKVVWLYLIEDYSMVEVAKILGIPENTAKSDWRLAAIDMATAWQRERAKERSRAWMALLAVLCFLVEVGRRLAGRDVASGSSRRKWGLWACAACSLLLVSQIAPDPTLSAGSAQIEAISPPSATVGHASSRPSADSAHPETPSAQSPQEAVSLVVPPDGGSASGGQSAKGPDRIPATSAGALARSSSGPKSSRSFGPKQNRSSDPEGSAKAATSAPLPPLPVEERARMHLKSVAELKRLGRNDAAKKLLELYLWVYPEDPYPQQRADLAAALATP